MKINKELNETFQKMYDGCVELLHKNENLLEKTTRSLVVCAILGENNKIYNGINLAWWHSVCAEPVALGSAWLDGVRNPKYVIAVKMQRNTKNIFTLSPCGICLQMFKELNQDIKIILKENDKFNIYTLKDLIPKEF